LHGNTQPRSGISLRHSGDEALNLAHEVRTDLEILCLLRRKPKIAEDVGRAAERERILPRLTRAPGPTGAERSFDCRFRGRFAAAFDFTLIAP